MILVTREDNMQLMSRYPDRYFDLAIVDPPYGVLNKTARGGDKKFNKNEYSKWDVKPDDSYFEELFRVSKNQIIWGGNYFGQLWQRSPYNKGYVIWDKNQPEALNNFSMAEMAWTSFDKPSKIFHFSVRKNKNKIHPTQKPVELYEWLLKMYAQPGDRILDTHLGSGTIAVACYRAGLSLTACEMSEEYFEKSCGYILQHVPRSSVEMHTDAYTCVLPKQFERTSPLYAAYMEQEAQLSLFEEERSRMYNEGKDTALTGMTK